MKHDPSNVKKLIDRIVDPICKKHGFTRSSWTSQRSTRDDGFVDQEWMRFTLVAPKDAKNPEGKPPEITISFQHTPTHDRDYHLRFWDENFVGSLRVTSGQILGSYFIPKGTRTVPEKFGTDLDGYLEKCRGTRMNAAQAIAENKRKILAVFNETD